MKSEKLYKIQNEVFELLLKMNDEQFNKAKLYPIMKF